MKKILTNSIVDPLIAQPFTGPSLEFLQSGQREMIGALCQNIIKGKGLSYNTSTPYLIAAISEVPFPTDGTIFFNGELYIMAENYAGLDYAMIDPALSSIDPLVFTDGVQRAVHLNRYLTFTNNVADALFPLSAVTNAYTPPVVVAPPKPVYAFQSFSNSVSANALDPVHLSMKCSSELFDDDNLYNTTTGVYTVPKTGYYRITGAATLRASATLTDGDYQFNIYKNGSVYSSFTFELYPFDGTNTNIEGDLIVKATAGDTLELYADGSFTAPSSAISYVSRIKVLVEYLYQ